MEDTFMCPKCTMENAYCDGTKFVCPDCDFEWDMGSDEDRQTIEPSPKLTMDFFDSIFHGSIFAKGETTDDANGINMSNSGRKLKWMAKKGCANDWTIYAHFADKSWDWIEASGDKVMSKINILKLVDCHENVFNLYRY